MRFQVPQFIETETKIVGPFTLKQFLYIALGSLAELETQIILSEQLGFLRNEKSNITQANMNELNKMITGLIKCL